MTKAKDKIQFIVRKYVFAKSAQEAIRLEKRTPVHDCWVNQDFVADKEDFGFSINDNKTRKEKK